MSLTPIQRDQARYKGGDEIKKRKSYLKRSATAIRQLADEAGQDLNALNGVFTDRELNLIHAAANLVDRASGRLAADIREADGIRAKYQRDLAAARKYLAILPRTDIADIVAICAADSGTRPPIDRIEMDSLRTTRWLRERINDLAAAALESLAWRCVRDGRNPADYAAGIDADMPELKARHADLISALNALAVANEMEKHA